MLNLRLLCGWRWVPLVAIITIMDQLSKLWVQHWLAQHGPIKVFSGFNLIVAHNTGVAFSFFSASDGSSTPYLLLASAIIIALLLMWLFTTPRSQKCLSIGLSFIIGGAIGNVIDRARLGYVIDFLDLYWQNWHWPTFNVADSFISIGAFLAFIAVWRQDQTNNIKEQS